MSKDFLPEEIFEIYMKGMEYRAALEDYPRENLRWDRNSNFPDELRMILSLKIKDRTLGVIDVRNIDSIRVIVETRWMADA